MQVDRHYNGTEFITGLRAFAVFLVYLIHSGGGGLSDVSEFSNTFVSFGKYGVQMFFVISGFTIFHQLSNGRYSLRRFLLIRISRISIPYFPLLLLIFMYISCGGEQFNPWANKFNDGNISIDNLIAHMTYLASFDLKYTNTIIGVEWSLHIEVVFYCVIGFLLTRGFINESPVNLLFWLSVWGFVAIVFLTLRYTNYLDPLLVQWMPFYYGWMFILGGAAFLIRKELVVRVSDSLANKVSNLFLLMSFLLLISLIVADMNSLVNEAVFSLLTAALLITTKDSAKFSWFLRNKGVLFFGSVSFSFYLLHYIVIFVQFSSELFGIENKTGIFVSNLLVTILISFFWYLFFERFIYNKAKFFINKKYI